MTSALGTDGQLKELTESSLDALRSQINGPIMAPGDVQYDEVRQVWNAMIDRSPALIAQCTGMADVLAVVRFAKEWGLQLSVRGAGHNIAGRALHDDVVMVDLSLLRMVRVDPERRIAVVSPGATLRDVDHETQAFGLAVPTGINSTTGIAGLTLGGGFGWLTRTHGMTVDNLLSAEVVTVDGVRRVCDEKENPDLFWALKGGGGNFGIVTSFTFQLHPVGPTVMCGPTVFDGNQAARVLRNYREFCKKTPEELTVWAVLRHAPPFPFVDPSYHGKFVVILVGLYNGPIGDGAEWFAKLKSFGAPLGDEVGPVAFEAFQQAFDPMLSRGWRNYWKSHNFKTIEDELIDVLVAEATKLPNLDTEIFFGQLGGQANNIASDTTAYPHRDVEFVMNVHTRWKNERDDDACVGWARELFEVTKPYATGGVYTNFVSEGDESVESAYAENTRRLASVKAKYDPGNVLRYNINIPPE